MMSANSKNLKLLSQEKLFSAEEFKKADKMERIYVYLMSGADVGPYRLTEAERKYLALMEKGYNMIFKQRSIREAEKMLREFCPPGNKRVTASKVLKDAQQLYGRFEEVDRTVQRGILREWLTERARKTEKAIKKLKPGEFYAANRSTMEKVLLGILKELREIDQLHKLEDDGNAPRPIPEIRFTDDESVLTIDVDSKVVG